MMGVTGCPRMARMRYPPTSSVSEICATISEIDHLSGAGRFLALAALTPFSNFASLAGAPACSFSGSRSPTKLAIRFLYCSAVSCMVLLPPSELHDHDCKPASGGRPLRICDFPPVHRDKLACDGPCLVAGNGYFPFWKL